jgi:hypothetical protein
MMRLGGSSGSSALRRRLHSLEQQVPAARDAGDAGRLDLPPLDPAEKRVPDR